MDGRRQLVGECRMHGTWTVTQSPSLPIHTFTAPEDGWLVTSHILELPSQLFIVDAQYTLPFAAEVVRYAKGLDKPLTRLYITHYHPDHLLGAKVFEAPAYALPNVAQKIAAAGDRVAREEHEKVGDEIPPIARQIDRLLAEGEERIEGIRIVHRRLHGAETEDALIIALPDADAIVVQDLVYNRSHPFLGERSFDGWRMALREHRALPYARVLPGHGVPGGFELYDEMIAYLDFAEASLKTACNAADFRHRLVDRFPYGGVKVLDHQLRFLFR